VLDGICQLAKTYGTGRAIAEGIPTVICGRTNAGKSSVYNRILGYDAAIVTDVEGTTRDVLRETASLGKTLLNLCDTAGLRHTDDRVESIGMERTRQEMERAGLILAVFDSSRPLSEEDLSLADEVVDMGIPAVALLNKSDCETACDITPILERFSHTVTVSAQQGTGFDALGEVIDELLIDGSLDVGQDAVVTGARQYAALNLAADELGAALNDLRAGISMDLCCVGIEQALSSLGEVDGRELGEEIVSEIFSRFCVGK
jgi:tRNA modification GTPase